VHTCAGQQLGAAEDRWVAAAKLSKKQFGFVQACEGWAGAVDCGSATCACVINFPGARGKATGSSKA
jgi:hypothetical protein